MLWNFFNWPNEATEIFHRQKLSRPQISLVPLGQDGKSLPATTSIRAVLRRDRNSISEWIPSHSICVIKSSFTAEGDDEKFRVIKLMIKMKLFEGIGFLFAQAIPQLLIFSSLLSRRSRRKFRNLIQFKSSSQIASSFKIIEGFIFSIKSLWWTLLLNFHIENLLILF